MLWIRLRFLVGFQVSVVNMLEIVEGKADFVQTVVQGGWQINRKNGSLPVVRVSKPGGKDDTGINLFRSQWHITILAKALPGQAGQGHDIGL